MSEGTTSAPQSSNSESAFLPRAMGSGRLGPPIPARSALVLALAALAYVGVWLASPMYGRAVHGDGYYTYLWARTIVFDGDLDFAADYRTCIDVWGLARSPVGDNVNYWNLGPALFWVPILAFDRLTHHPALDSTTATDAAGCIGPLAERAVMGSLFAALLTIFLGYLVARRHFGEGPALFGAIVIGFGSSLLYHGTTLLSYGHAASACGGALLLYAWDGARRRPGWWTWGWVGVAMGITLLMRSQNVVLGALPFLTFLEQLWDPAVRRDTRGMIARLAQGALAAIAASAVFAPQLYFWYRNTGTPFAVSQGEHYMRWTEPQLVQALFSTGAGLFPWQPAMYVAVAGLIALTARPSTRRVGLALAAVMLLDSYVVACVYDWWGSVGFPGRRFDAIIAPSMFACAAFAAWVTRGPRRSGALPRLAAAAVVLVIALHNLAVLLAIGTGYRADLQRTSIDHARGLLDQGFAPMYRATGNPLTWPASLPFSLLYGQHPRDWDVVGSQEWFYHDHQTLEWRELEGRMPLFEPWADGYMSGSVGQVSDVRGRPARVFLPGSSRVLMPLHWHQVGRLSILASRVEPASEARLGVTFNGVDLGMHTVATAYRAIDVEVPDGLGRHGWNDLWLWVEGAPIGITEIVIRDPEPPPRIEQARRNAAERERRQRALRDQN